MSQTTPHTLDRYTQLSDLGNAVHNLFKRGIAISAVILLIGVAALYFSDNPGWLSLLMMGIGTLIAFKIWDNKGIGLPILPVFALQHLIAFGTPIISQDEKISYYPPDYLLKAGFEVGLFLLVLSLMWRFGMEVFSPSPPLAYALNTFESDSSHSRIRIALILVISTTAYNVADALQASHFLFDLLPSGTSSLVTAVIKAVTMSGYFLLAMLVSSREAPPSIRAVFWITMVLNLVISASGFLLSSATDITAAVTIGLFWGSRRIPWAFIITLVSILSFLHLGKFEMRERYWNADDEMTETAADGLPQRYEEWILASFNNLSINRPALTGFEREKPKTASMIERVNNLQNLLFAIHAVDGKKIETLDGATYALIPPLLIPRILWPDKPRAHEGQVLLNVHFERQSAAATIRTYIAWGLLPEAYGNFGGVWGAVFLGAFLGIPFAWIENFTARKPLLSMEGLVTFACFIGLAVSFEMVASVLITSLFQTIIIIIMACAPFVHQALVVRPVDSPAKTVTPPPSA